jgi:hypothetical protein
LRSGDVAPDVGVPCRLWDELDGEFHGRCNSKNSSSV